MLRSYRRATPGANIPGTSHVTSLLMKQAVPGRLLTVCPFRQMIEGVNVSCVPHCQCLFRESAPGTRRVGLTLMTASISVRHQPYMRKPLPSNDRRTDRRNPLESSREPEPSRTTIVRGGVNGGDGSFFRRKSLFSRAEIGSLHFCGRNPQNSSKTGEGGSGGGACFPVHPLVKRLFDKLPFRR